MNQKLLTVGIPNYNRADYLEKLLLELKKENAKLFDIMVIDDCSPDDGASIAVLKKLKPSMPNLTYLKNSENIGFSRNVYKLYKNTRTPYIWFLCNDEDVIPGCITKIIAALKTYQPTIAVFNCYWQNPFGQKRVAGPSSDIFHTDFTKFLNYQPLMRTIFLSIDVFKKENITLPVPDLEIADNIFVQLTIAIRLLSDNFKLLEKSDVIVNRNVGYKYGEFVKFNLVDHFKAITVIKHPFKLEKFISWSKKIFNSFIFLFYSQKIGLFIYSGTLSSKTINLFKKYYGSYYYFKLRLFMFVYRLVPVFLIRWGYFLTLIYLHGLKAGILIYNNNINRAFIDQRKTLFTNYQ